MNNYSDRTDCFDENNYEYNSKSKTGILLIHGFTSTTYELKKIGEFLAKNNIFVRFDNLPGHGTTIHDCNSIQYTEWLKFVEQRFADMSSKCDYIYVLGISMGALLAMHLSTLFPVHGLISAAPVLEFNKPFKVHVLNRLLCRIVKYRRKKYEINPGQKNFYGYNKWPLIGLDEVRKLSNYIYRDVIPNITCPCLLIHSKNDYTSVFNNHKILRNTLKANDVDSLIVNQSPHNIFDCDLEKEIIQETIINFIIKNGKSN